MRAYVETNFLLEIVLSQEQHPSCEEIVRFCENGSISLALPAFCVPEAYFALAGKRTGRDRFVQDFKNQSAQLIRSFRFKDRADLLSAVQGLLTESILREDQEFYASLNRCWHLWR